MNENSTSIANVARGQKFIIYAILIYLFVIGIQIVVGVNLGPFAGFFGMAAIVFSFVGLFQLSSGLGYAIGVKILLALLMLVPPISFITLFVLNFKATQALRAANYKVGLFGVKD